MLLLLLLWESQQVVEFSTFCYRRRRLSRAFFMRVGLPTASRIVVKSFLRIIQVAICYFAVLPGDGYDHFDVASAVGDEQAIASSFSRFSAGPRAV